MDAIQDLKWATCMDAIQDLKRGNSNNTGVITLRGKIVRNGGRGGGREKGGTFSPKHMYIEVKRKRERERERESEKERKRARESER